MPAYELGRESISGTPGTSASLTLTAATSPAFPRMSEVAVVGVPLSYTIEDSTGQVLCTGMGVSTGAGAFTRVLEWSHYGGTYSDNPSSLYSLPSGCVIYLSANRGNMATLYGPASAVDANQWINPTGLVCGTGGTFSTANRDHYWRSMQMYPHKVDAIAIHAAGAASFDIGMYEVNPSTGSPGILLIGWQGVTVAAGMNTVTLASATLGALSAAAQRLPTGDVYWMLNLSASSCSRTVANVGPSGSDSSDLSAAKSVLYRSRTNNTSFGDTPTLTGRLTTTTANVPMIPLRGA